jgi:hypothetical protein
MGTPIKNRVMVRMVRMVVIEVGFKEMNNLKNLFITQAP